MTTLRNILPEQVLVDILAERFQVSYSLLFLFLVVINIMFRCCQGLTYNAGTVL